MHYTFSRHLFSIPIVKWITTYKKDFIVPDIIAGLTIGIMIIPQSIAYTTLVGIKPQYGLYTSIAGGISYAIFGNVRQANIGPSAVLALLSYQFAGEGNPELIALITFLIGVSALLFAFLKLGFVIDFVSMPVISGYTSAVTLVIFTAQIKGLLGLHFQAENFVTTLIKLGSNIEKAKIPDAALGILCFIFLVLMKQIKNWKYFVNSKTFFYLSVSKSALVVVVSSILAFGFERNGLKPFSLTGNITGGLPPIKLPNLEPTHRGEELSFFGVMSVLSLGLPTITCIAIITTVVIGKAYTKGEKLNTTYEIVALGASNILGSLIGSMPVTGSFSRSAVNHSCDVKTPISGIYTALLVLLSCAVLTPYFYFIPRATLAAVVMSAIISMFDYEIILPLWKTCRKDLIPLLGTFFSSLILGVEKGLLFGLIIDLLFVLYYNARPTVSVSEIIKNGENYVVITPRNGLLYPAANYIHKTVAIQSHMPKKEKSYGYVLNMIHIPHIDFTTLQTIKSLVSYMILNEKELLLTNVRRNLKLVLLEELPKLRILETLELPLEEV